MTSKEDLQTTALKILIGLINKGIVNKIYSKEEIIMFNGCISLFLPKQPLETIKEEEEKIDI